MPNIDIDWGEEAGELYNETAKLVLRIFQAGGKVGQSLLPKRVQGLVDWDVVSQAALDYLKMYQINTVEQITETTRKRATRAIEDWIQSGEPLDVLVSRLEPWMNTNRAENIAITEVTRAYSAGNQISWMSTGFVSGSKWHTANDEKVCIVCGPLDGVEVPMGEGFTPDGPGFGPTAPPLHNRCRCWTTPVVDIESVRGQIRGILNR